MASPFWCCCERAVRDQGRRAQGRLCPAQGRPCRGCGSSCRIPPASTVPAALADALSGLGAAPHWYVALSGGVDSAVAAMLLRNQGYAVRGLFMKNWEEDDRADYCAAAADLADARAVAERLAPQGIFAQWMQAYEVDAITVQTVYATLRSVFPVVAPMRRPPRRTSVTALPPWVSSRRSGPSRKWPTGST